jgi:imidazolonepropionase-like amidohydrolase
MWQVSDLLGKGLEALALAENQGVNICFGSDLLGGMHKHQLEEFSLRCRVQSAASVLRSATTTCAQLFNMEGDVGVVAPGAFADLVVLRRNPLADAFASLITDPATAILMVLKEGRIFRSSSNDDVGI